MKRLAIIGAKEFAEHITDFAIQTGQFEVVGYYDNIEPKGNVVKGKPVFGPVLDAVEGYNSHIFDEVFIAVGYTRFDLREQFFYQLKGKVPLANIISPAAYIHPSATLGEGILISDGSFIHRDVVIEDNVCITLHSIVNHGGYVKKHTFFSTGVVTAGNVTVGEKCFVGVGCVISDGVTICDNVWLSPGSVVVKNLKKPGHYMSSSAKLFNIG